MSDNSHLVWRKFFDHRTKSLWERFPGVYRSLVVETADPLNMGRVRFKCPDLHDFDVNDQECPWAVPAPEMGGVRAGRFLSPIVGDTVWIVFERQHPYGPVWIGYADPTRRKLYPLPSVYVETPVPVDAEGRPRDRPLDYDPAYLPNDRRPMSHGWQDRYGTLDLTSSVGFYPREHSPPPTPPGQDAVSGSRLAQHPRPLVNRPDVKHSSRITKYGNMLILGDQGYWWQRPVVQPPAVSSLGEFTGDPVLDEKFEIARWKYLQRLLNEGRPDSAAGDRPVQFGDQRRAALWTRYGHRFELRDVGWAQRGPVQSTTRKGEYGEPRTLSLEDRHDFRWVKLRTKGGWLLQAYDKGFHPQEDRYIRRRLLDEVGHRSEREDKHWEGKDARWFRIAGRYGTKIVLDDRGAHDRDADHKELPRGNGLLMKGRRSPAAAGKARTGNPRGFYFEWNENDELNHMTMGTPLGAALELNDRYEYVCVAASLGRGYATKWRNLAENEFLLQPTRHPARDPEHRSHHLVLDHENEYVRCKTRAGRGPKPDHVVNPPDVAPGEEHQGFEAHDGRSGRGPWVELVDCQSRGLWFSKYQSLGIWRGKSGSSIYQWLDDTRNILALYNGSDGGKLQIYSRGDVEIMGAKSVVINGSEDVSVKAGGRLVLQGGSSVLTLQNGSILYNSEFLLGGQGVQDLLRPELPPVVEPDDRAAMYNGPIQECPRWEVEHPTGGAQ